MLSFGDELHDRTAALIEDVGRLHLVSAIGYAVKDVDLLRKNRASLAAGPWRYLELDGADDLARSQLVEAWSAEHLVIMLPERLPRALIELVRAFADERPTVDLGDMIKRERRLDQSLVLLVYGAYEPELIPPDLRRVICWEFVP